MSPSERKQYWWLKCIDPETSKPYLIFGSSKNEADARREGMSMLSGIDFQIVMLHTRSLQAASSQIKGNRLKKTHDLGRASERLGHSKSARRRLESRRNRQR